MHDVNPQWNGLSESYEVGYEDSFLYESNERGEYSAEVPNYGLPERQVVQIVDSADLPPLPKSSTTGLCEPNMPNPFVRQRDASYALTYDERFHHVDDSFPATNDAWTSRVPHDPAPEAESAQQCWTKK